MPFVPIRHTAIAMALVARIDCCWIYFPNSRSFVPKLGRGIRSLNDDFGFVSVFVLYSFLLWFQISACWFVGNFRTTFSSVPKNTQQVDVALFSSFFLPITNESNRIGLESGSARTLLLLPNDDDNNRKTENYKSTLRDQPPQTKVVPTEPNKPNNQPRNYRSSRCSRTGFPSLDRLCFVSGACYCICRGIDE